MDSSKKTEKHYLLEYNVTIRSLENGNEDFPDFQWIPPFQDASAIL